MKIAFKGMEYKRIYKDGSNLFIGRIGTIIIGLINLMILTRILTTEEMGKYSLFLMVVNLALVLGLNWSDASIVRHGREEFVKHKKINQSFWARFYLFFPMLIVFTLFFIIFSKQISNYIGIEQGLIIFVIGMFVFNGLIKSITYMYQSIDQMKQSAFVLFFQKLFYLIGLVLLFFNVFTIKLSLILILINLSFLVSLIMNLIRFDFNLLKPYKFNKHYFKKIWSYSWPQFIGFSGLYIINYIDLYVIRKYLTLHDVGVYSVAYNGFTMICGVIMIINTIFMPLIVEYRAKKRFDLITKYMKKIPLFSFGWMIIVGIGLLLSFYIIPLVFSTKYVDSIPSFNVLLITSIFYFCSVCFVPLVNAFDLVLYSQMFNLIKSIVNIITDFMFVPSMGIIGAAYGTLISIVVGFLLSILLIYMKKEIIFQNSTFN